ncbi:Do family serine endopeptidase [Verticiella sediminum]|uniref:Probable periplasmic serine endoprotease DegP-like n=2 Tax=Verticiella sediminum TaxID=1247510 RepID=A0A556AS23_9BURK|nr:Do family serine endopeptidase [Verticiella sediminum]
MSLMFMRLMRRACGAVLLGASLAVASPVLAQPVVGPDFTSVVEKVDPGVVNIRTTASIRVAGRGPGGGSDPYELFRWFFGPDFAPPGRNVPPGTPPQTPPGGGGEERSVPRGVGSGFFISQDGYILTNHHVVDGADGIVVTLTDGREFKAEVIGSDQRTDVALIKVDTKDAPVLNVGEPKALRKGEWVLAFGSPFGLDSTVTAGIVSAIGRDTGDYLPFIQTDVAVNPGNSGGPLVNLNGQVVGINSQIVSRSGGFMGISLAIPIDEAMRVVQQLRETGQVVRGRIGVQVGEVSEEVGRALGLERAQGALVSGVERGGPADRAGIEAGDVVLKFNGQDVRRVSDLPRMVGNTKPGTAASIQVWRKGKTVDLKIEVDRMEPDTPPAGASKESGAPEQATNALGLAVTDLTNAQRNELRVQGGVRVERAEGAAASAGIAAGDVILGVNNTDVSNAKQFNELVGKLESSRTHVLLVRRGDVTQWVPVRPAR